MISSDTAEQIFFSLPSVNDEKERKWLSEKWSCSIRGTGSLCFCICWLAGRKVDASIYSLFCVHKGEHTHTYWLWSSLVIDDKMVLVDEKKNTCQGYLGWLREDNTREEHFEDIFEALHIS